MRLTELSPEWVKDSDEVPEEKAQRFIDFRCPKCPDEPMEGYKELRDRIIIPVTTQREGPGTGWGWNGEQDFEKVTLTPSIFHHCVSEAHFFITNGDIIFA